MLVKQSWKTRIKVSYNSSTKQNVATTKLQHNRSLLLLNFIACIPRTQGHVSLLIRENKLRLGSVIRTFDDQQTKLTSQLGMYDTLSSTKRKWLSLLADIIPLSPDLVVYMGPKK